MAGPVAIANAVRPRQIAKPRNDVHALGQASNSGEAVKAGVEGQNSLDAMLFHDRKMNRISRGEAMVAEDDLLCAFGSRTVDRQDIVHNAKKRVECKLDIVTTIDGGVTVQDLLEDFRVCDQSLTLAHKPLQ